MPAYNRLYPDIEFAITEDSSLALEELLDKGQIDLLIGFAPIKGNDIEQVPLRSEKLYILIPSAILESAFDGDKDAWDRSRAGFIDIKDFAECPFLMISTNNRVRMLADIYLKKNGVRPNIILQAESIETLFALCLKGMGITFYPEMFVEKINPSFFGEAHTALNAFPISDRETTGQLVIAYSKNRYLSNAVKEFISFTQNHYKIQI